MIFLDYASTSPLREEVLQEMLPYFRERYANPDSVHALGREAALAVTRARDMIAEHLGVSAGEVYFTSGGTEADNWAVRNLGYGHALVSSIEHAAVLSAAPLRAGGASFFPVEPSGVVSPEKISENLKEETGLICLMKVNNETGCIQPVEETAKICKERNILLFSDCVQAATTQDLKHVLKFADAISLSAHKIGGPKGVGALIVKKGTPLKALIAGGEQERGLRGGTLNVPGIVGFAHALKLAQEEKEFFSKETLALRELFEGKLKERLGEEVSIDGENRVPNITHVTFLRGGGEILQLLDLNGVAASGGAACSAHAALPSHVLTAMGRTEETARRGVRFSFGKETTKEEILKTVEIIARLSMSS